MSDLLGSLLDQDLSEIAELPTYEIPPKGYYRLHIAKVEQKTADIKDSVAVPLIQVDYQVVECLELADETQREDVKPNQIFSETFFFYQDVEMTKKAIRTVYKDIGEKLKCKTLANLVESLQGLTVCAQVGHRKDKNDKDKFYAKLTNLVLD
jgi:hypothetical protein